jgi:hypothetical protein
LAVTGIAGGEEINMGSGDRLASPVEITTYRSAVHGNNRGGGIEGTAGQKNAERKPE